MRAATCVLVIFVIRLALALGSVPPWQNPDEPQHVMAVWFTGAHDTSPDAVARMERAVIESMARHRWWELVGESTPSPLPARFADDKALEERWITMPRTGGLYYAVAAAVCATPSPEHTLEAARRLSAAAGLGVVVLAIAIGRSLLASWTGVGVGAVLALHPQFLVVATTASADAFIALLSTGAIWMAVAALSSARPQIWLTAAAVTTFAALLSRKLGLTVLPVTCWAIAVVVTARGRREAVKLGIRSSVVLAAGGAAVSWWYAIELEQLVADTRLLWNARPREFDPWTGLVGLHRSTWMTAGWLRFGPAEVWHLTAGLATAVGAIGILAVAMCPPRRGHARAAVALGCGAAALQVAALLGRQVVAGEVSQGRYLAPVAVPLALLLWLGTVEAVPPHWRRLAAAVLLLWLATFDAVAWAQVIWPAFS